MTSRFQRSAFTRVVWFLLLVVLAGGPVGVAAGRGDAALSRGITPRDDPPDGPSKNEGRASDIVPGEVVVKFRTLPDRGAGAGKTGFAAFDAAGTRFGVYEVQPKLPFLDRVIAGRAADPGGLAGLRRVYRLRYTSADDPRAVAAALARDPRVEYAEPVFRRRLSTVEPLPVDPSRDDPSHVDPSHVDPSRVGPSRDDPSRDGPFRDDPSRVDPSRVDPDDPQYANMTHLTTIRAPEAWDVVRGETGTALIAVVDGGTDWQHEDLIDNVWTNPGEIAGNGVDDDGNGFVDDIHGWNFANNGPDPKGLTGTPQNGSHGTRVAGIAAATTNNGKGISGMGWNARFMAINAGCSDEDNAICYGFDGMLYAALNGADVINASFGGPGISRYERDVLATIAEEDALIVAAAGNDSENLDLNPQFPANGAGVLSVGATMKTTDEIASSFTNYGATVGVFAPGVGINSTGSPNQYPASNNGTSFSTPLVTGLAALVKTLHAEWTAVQVREQVRVTAEDINGANIALYRDRMGSGRVNALEAVTATSPSVRVHSVAIDDESGNGSIEGGESIELTLEFINHLAPASDVQVTLTASDFRITVTQAEASLGTLSTGGTALATFRFDLAATTPSEYTLRFVAEVQAADGYTDREPLTLIANRVTHDTGTVTLTLTDEGNLGWTGYQDDSGGNGFQFLGTDYLFEGGLLVGTSAQRVSDAVRGTGDAQDADFERVEGTDFAVASGRETSEEGVVVLADTPAPVPIGVRVRQDSYADTTEGFNDFIVLKYAVTNATDALVNGLYLGLFFDWDINLESDTDHARYDASRRMSIAMNDADSPDVLFATRLLTDGGITHHSIDNPTEIYGGSAGDGFTDEEKWDFLSGGVQRTTLNSSDVSLLTASGPYAIAPNETVEIAFAVVAGSSLDDLNANADRAESLWTETLQFLGPNLVAAEQPGATPAGRPVLEPAYPNPASTETTFAFVLPAPAPVRLAVYDVLGREVRVLVDEMRPSGAHRIRWDGTDTAGRAVASGLYVYRLTATTPAGRRSETGKLVVTR